MVIYIFGKLLFAMQYKKYLPLYYIIKFPDLTTTNIHTVGFKYHTYSITIAIRKVSEQTIHSTI